jgi:hypothetical protein
MSAGRRLATALAAAVILVPALVTVGPASAAPERADRTPDVALYTTFDEAVTQVRPPVLAGPPITARSSVRAYPRPLFAFWGARYNRIDGFRFTTAHRGSGTSVQVEAAWKTYRGVKPILPKKVFLQARVDGGRWSKVSGTRGRIRKHYVVARAPAHVVPAGVVSQRVDYRLKTRKITRGPRTARRSVASKPVTVTFDNQAMYTGDQARFYAHIATLCPNASIHLDTTGITGDRGGVFSWQYGITVDPADMAARVDEPEISKLGTAIHECAHMLQFYNWGGTLQDWPTMKERSAAVFVPDDDPNGPTVAMAPDWSPLEHAADCAKELISPERWRTYGGYCNPAEYAAANLLWQNQTY